MTKDELITQQQLEIEDLKIAAAKVAKIKRSLNGLLYNIGNPMNDNIMKMNMEQLGWCCRVEYLVKQL